MKVLIAIDNSECSAAAVNAVADRSWPPGTTFEVITVCEPVSVNYCYAGACALGSMEEIDLQVHKYCSSLVDDIATRLKAIFGKGRVSSQVIQGPIAESIIEHAKESQADLIVVGSHGRTGIKRFLIGSVAGKVVGASPCSIEVVREKQVRTEKKAAAADKAMLLVAHH